MRLATIRTKDGTTAVGVDDDGAVEPGAPDLGEQRNTMVKGR